MSHTVSIPIPLVRAHFQTAGFTDEMIATVLATLILIWRANDLVEDITRETIFTELDLDELMAQMLWSAVGRELTNVAQQIRNFAVQGRLIRWVVHPFAILLELEDEIDIAQCGSTSAD